MVTYARVVRFVGKIEKIGELSAAAPIDEKERLTDPDNPKGALWPIVEDPQPPFDAMKEKPVAIETVDEATRTWRVAWSIAPLAGDELAAVKAQRRAATDQAAIAVLDELVAVLVGRLLIAVEDLSLAARTTLAERATLATSAAVLDAAVPK